MIATKIAYTNKGCPYPGSEKVFCATVDVLAIGRLEVYGDAVERCMVRTDRGVFFVVISKQVPDVAKWLSKKFRAVVPVHYSTREVPFTETWVVL